MIYINTYVYRRRRKGASFHIPLAKDSVHIGECVSVEADGYNFFHRNSRKMFKRGLD